MRSQKSSNRPNRRRPFAIRQVYGHSMMPVLPPGTIVFGWRWFRRLRPGDVVIFWHNNKEKIKRIDRLEDRKVYVLGDHEPASTDSRDFGWLDADTVIARLVWPRAPKHMAEGVEPE
jgi:phage repressor protein C with HTH and peptisase S24 domain